MEEKRTCRVCGRELEIDKFLTSGGKPTHVCRECAAKKITITALEALDVIGTMRLAALVFNLREKGYDIRTEKITVPSGKRVALYRFYDNGL